MNNKLSISLIICGATLCIYHYSKTIIHYNHELSNTPSGSINSRNSSLLSQSAIPVKNLNKDLSQLLSGSTSSSNDYLQILHWLNTNETNLLKALGERYYDHALSTGEPQRDEISTITRAFIEFYRSAPLFETLLKFEYLYPSGALYSNVVAELFAYTEGWENTNTMYNWIMANPDENAALQSGSVIGGKLIDFDSEYAWGKSVLLPEGTIRAGALSSVLASIAAENLDRAIELTYSISSSPDLDRAISDLVTISIASGKRYEDIVSLAIIPIDSNYRIGTLTELFNQWGENDFQSLKKWLSENQHYTEEIMSEINLLGYQALQSHSMEAP